MKLFCFTAQSTIFEGKFRSFDPFPTSNLGLRKLSRAICLATATLLPAPALLVQASLSVPAGAQTPAPAAASARQIGTVKQVTPNKLMITTDAGQSISVNVVEGARVLQLAPGSTDLKSAQTITLGDISMGDRVLVIGHPDAPDAMTVARVILMKSTDIAEKHQAEQDDWQRRGSGGLVTAVDPATGTVTIIVRGKKTSVETTPSTVFRRYTDGSVKYEDAALGTLAQIQVGDQLRVRGSRSEGTLAGDPGEIKAEEIVSGSFKNLAGTIVAIDPTANTLTLKDLATKKTYSIKVTSNSAVKALPPEAAARFAARAKGPQAPGTDAASKPVSASPPSGPGDHPSGQGSAGGDLSQMLNRLPQQSLAGLHPGDALMVVASQADASSDSLTAVTLLSGVEPILAATPKGSSSMTLSPWNMDGPEGGGM